MNNTWNQLIYKIWSPIYDHFFNSGNFLEARKQIFNEIIFENGQKILFVGVGTGADLERIDKETLDITAIDLSKDMLAKASAKSFNSSVKFIQMDAQKLDFEDHSFDIIIANLILSVVPNPTLCLNEMERVLKEQGNIIIFDKFVKRDERPSFSKRLIRPIIRILGTDIGLQFEKIFNGLRDTLMIDEDVPVMLNGMYRKISISKNKK